MAENKWVSRGWKNPTYRGCNPISKLVRAHLVLTGILEGIDNIGRATGLPGYPAIKGVCRNGHPQTSASWLLAVWSSGSGSLSLSLWTFELTATTKVQLLEHMFNLQCFGPGSVIWRLLSMPQQLKLVCWRLPFGLPHEFDEEMAGLWKRLTIWAKLGRRPNRLAWAEQRVFIGLSKGEFFRKENFLKGQGFFNMLRFAWKRVIFFPETDWCCFVASNQLWNQSGAYGCFRR